MHSIFLLFVLGLSVCFEELNAIQLSKTQPVVFLAQLKAVRRMLCMLSTYSFTFRSGSEEQYAEKEQLLQEIVDIHRDLEEEPKRKTRASANSQERDVAEVIRSQALSSLRSLSTALTQTAAGPSSACMSANANDASGNLVQTPTSVPSAKKKRRLNKHGDNDVIGYLQAKQESDAEWRDQELDVRKKELNLAEKKLEWEKERVANEQKQREERWKFEKEEREERLKLETEERRSLMDILKTVVLNNK